MSDAQGNATDITFNWRQSLRASLGYVRGMLLGMLVIVGFVVGLLSLQPLSAPAYEPIIVPVKLLASSSEKRDTPKLMPLAPQNKPEILASAPVPLPDVPMPAPEPTDTVLAVTPIPDAAADTPAIPTRPAARLAVLVMDAGLNRRLSSLLSQSLPKPIAVSFSPYAPDLQASLNDFKKSGHEVWLELAVRSKKPGVDKGPLALSQSLSLPDNLSMLDLQTKKASGLVAGVTIRSDADITSAHEIWTALSKELVNRNFIILDATPEIVPLELLQKTDIGGLTAYLKANAVLEGQQPRNDFANALDKATAEAIEMREMILVVNAPTRITLEELARWAASLPQSGVTLVPLSELTGLKP